jgi:hypothetical protein
MYRRFMLKEVALILTSLAIAYVFFSIIGPIVAFFALYPLVKKIL